MDTLRGTVAKAKKAQSDGTVSNMLALSRATGKPRSTLQRWRKDDRWPFGNPPWVPADVLAWGEETMDHDRAMASKSPKSLGREEREASLRLKRARADLLEFQRKVESGKFHDVAECKRRRLRQIHAVKEALLDVPRSLAPLVLGEADVDRIERIMEDRLMEILRGFAGEGQEA